MANTKTIDVDKFLLVPIPVGITKQGGAELVAKHNGYTAKVTKEEKKTFEGTAEEWQAFELANENEVFAENTETTATGVKVTYNHIQEIDNPLTKMQFGLKTLIQPMGDILKQAIRQENLEAVRLQAENMVKQAEQQVEVSLETFNDVIPE